MKEHLLSVLVFTPLAGALALLFVPGRERRLVRGIANAFFAATLAMAAWLTATFAGAQAGYQFVERASWIPSLGVQYLLGADGISVLMAVLTTVIGLLAAVYSGGSIRYREREFYALLLVQTSTILGVFFALDLFLFFLFWELSLVPMYFLIGIWGGERRQYAAIKFFLYTLGGSAFLLLGFILLFLQYQAQFGRATFELTELIKVQMPLPLELAVFGLLFVGFAVKTPMFPFHTWLPDAHVEAPTAGSVMLAGVLLKMGTYGFLRFAVPLAPQAAAHPVVTRVMAALSIIAILYGALVSLMQQDWKKLVAYSSVSHMGFCTLGLFALNANGIGGSVIQQVNHGISTSMLFLLVGMVYERRHTRLIQDFGGLAHIMPHFAKLFAVAMFSSAGLPLLNGFIGEFTILQGAFERNWRWAAWAVPGVVLSAAYLLWLYQRTMLGELANPRNLPLRDLTAREWLTLGPLAVAAVVIGVYPKPLFDLLRIPVEALVRSLA